MTEPRLEDGPLLSQFEACSLPMEQWTHEAHVRVAFLYTSTSSEFTEALDRMRSGIQAHNEANDIPSAIDQGYHETLTRAFMAMVFAANTQTGPHEHSGAFCRAHPELMNKRAVLKHYSRERIMTMNAKLGFVEPDLVPLPTL